MYTEEELQEIGQKNVPTSDILRRITEKIGIYGVADIISPIRFHFYLNSSKGGRL